jgi:hypothetical protein
MRPFSLALTHPQLLSDLTYASLWAAPSLLSRHGLGALGLELAAPGLGILAPALYTLWRSGTLVKDLAVPNSLKNLSSILFCNFFWNKTNGRCTTTRLHLVLLAQYTLMHSPH